MNAQNCWEVMACGRQEGGANAAELGVCPASQPGEFEGTNRGQARGRFCWAISGTLCSGYFSGHAAEKWLACAKCKFMVQVSEEESSNFVLNRPGPHGI